MKSTVHSVEHFAILANTALPVHLVLRFDMLAVAAARPHQIAFSLVSDCSVWMAVAPPESVAQ